MHIFAFETFDVTLNIKQVEFYVTKDMWDVKREINSMLPMWGNLKHYNVANNIYENNNTSCSVNSFLNSVRHYSALAPQSKDKVQFSIQNISFLI